MHFILCIWWLVSLKREEEKTRERERKPIVLRAGWTAEKCVERRKALSILQRPSCYDTVDAGVDVDSFLEQRRLSSRSIEMEWNGMTCSQGDDLVICHRQKMIVDIIISREIRHNPGEKCLTGDLSRPRSRKGVPVSLISFEIVKRVRFQGKLFSQRFSLSRLEKSSASSRKYQFEKDRMSIRNDRFSISGRCTCHFFHWFFFWTCGSLLFSKG